MSNNAQITLHPRLWQIADVDTYKKLYDVKDSLDEHIDAVDKELNEFYARTGTDEEFFESSPAPNVSTQVYSKYVGLRHDSRYLIPNLEFARNYIELTLKLNELLFTHDFDYCLKYFEKHLEEVQNKRSELQLNRAMADGMSKFLLSKHKEFRDKDNAPISDDDKAQMFEYAIEFLVDDHGWSAKDAATVVKAVRS